MVRINGVAVNPNFVVQVRPGTAPAQSHVTNDLSAMHCLTRSDSKARQVAVSSNKALRVRDFDHPSVAPGEISEINNAVGRRDYPASVCG